MKKYNPVFSHIILTNDSDNVLEELGSYIASVAWIKDLSIGEAVKVAMKNAYKHYDIIRDEIMQDDFENI